jgi:hypothetical protein
MLRFAQHDKIPGYLKISASLAIIACSESVASESPCDDSLELARVEAPNAAYYTSISQYRRSNAVRRPVILSEAKNPDRDSSLRSE